MKTRYQLAIFLLMTAFGLQSCSKQGASGEQSSLTEPASVRAVDVLMYAKKDLAKVGIQIGQLAIGSYEKTVFATGIIDLPPQNIATICLFTPGIISSIKVYPGVKVSKGDVLCEVSHPDIISIQEEYLKSKSQLVQIKAEAERMAVLSQEDAVAIKRSQVARADLNALKYKIESLEQKILEIGLNPSLIEKQGIFVKVPVRATLSGYVQDVLVNQGKMVQMGEALFNLIDPSHMHLELKVFEKDAASIRDGQTISFSTKANPNQWYPASIYVAGKALDNTTNTVSIHGHFHQENHKLLAGSTVSAKINVGDARGIVLPSGAFVKSEGKAIVYQVVKDGKDSIGLKAVLISNFQEEGSQIIVEKLQSNTSKWVINGADMVFTANLEEEE